MKIGVMSDIHGNLFALQKVLYEMQKHQVEHIVNAGDNVGYSVFPNECIELLKDDQISSAMGNYDEAVAYDRPACGCGEGDERVQGIRLASLQWAQKHTSPANKAFLKTLPKKLQIDVFGSIIIAMHGGLDELNELILPEDHDKMKDITSRSEAEIVILGHTHKPFVGTVNGRLFVNPGSVGKPENGSPLASYAIIDVPAKNAQIHYTQYDVESNIRFIREAGLPDAIAENIRTGISFAESGSAHAADTQRDFDRTIA